MNANYKKLIEADRIKIYHDQSNFIAQSVIAAVLLAMHRRGRTKKYIQDLYADILDVLNQPPVFGKDMTDTEVMQYLTDEYGIDFNKVHLRLESETEIRKRERKEKEKI